MSGLKKRPSPEQPAAWLQRAESDLALARHAVNAKDVLTEDAMYHAQQCAEKALKAVLLQVVGHFPFVHDLDLLVEQLETHGVFVPEYIQNSGDLTPYAVQLRYPGDWEPVGEVEMEDDLALADRIFQWAKAEIVSIRDI